MLRRTAAKLRAPLSLSVRLMAGPHSLSRCHPGPACQASSSSSRQPALAFISRHRPNPPESPSFLLYCSRPPIYTCAPHHAASIRPPYSSHLTQEWLRRSNPKSHHRCSICRVVASPTTRAASPPSHCGNQVADTALSPSVAS
jgi:hypothetical protein